MLWAPMLSRHSTSRASSLAGGLLLLLSGCETQGGVDSREPFATGPAHGTGSAEGSSEGGDEAPAAPEAGSSSTDAEPDASDSSSTTLDSTGGDTVEPPSPPAGLCVGEAVTHSTTYLWVRNGAQETGACDVEVAPCGGDPAGSWALDEICEAGAGETDLFPECESDSWSSTPINTEGVAVFGPDGTYTASSSGELLLEYAVQNPEMCPGSTCEDLQSAVPGAYCTGIADDICTCAALVPSDAAFVRGPYTLHGDRIVLPTPDGRQTPPSPYCVNQDRLTIVVPTLVDVELGQPCDAVDDCLEHAADFEEVRCDRSLR